MAPTTMADLVARAVYRVRRAGSRMRTYRVLYRINDTAQEVVVLRIDHRRDAYRHG